MKYRGKTFATADRTIIALAVAQWETEEGTFVKLGNGWVYEAKEFDLFFSKVA